MTYLRDHWLGQHPLARAFWINFLIPFVVISMAEPWIRPAAAGGGTGQSVAAALYIILAHAVVLPWQIVGLWRSSRRHLKERGDLGVVTFAQGAALVALITAAGATLTTMQRLTGFGMGATEWPAATPRYVLKVLPESDVVLIDGMFDTGISRDLRALLAEDPTIETVVLSSDGGRVFEARGVARQIVERGLDTHVDSRCRSACTIAYVAGLRRTLAEGGRLGFHSYRLGGFMPFLDPQDEQGKDRTFFLERGIEPAFVERAFDTPHDQIWQPDAERLLEAGVVHDLLKAAP